MLTLTIKNDVSEMAALEPFVEQVSETYKIDPATCFQLQLALDESLTNSVLYAYPDQKDMPITLEADLVEEEGQRKLSFCLIDQGIPFDPLAQAPDVDITMPVEDRPIGGLGIFLVKQMMDEIFYKRDGDRNILTMIKKI